LFVNKYQWDDDTIVGNFDPQQAKEAEISEQ
jgi:hypothetical protein